MNNFLSRGDFVARGRRFANRRLRPGSRTVLWTDQQGLGFGNFLYLWLHARIEARRNRSVVIRHSPAMDPWLDRFPMLNELTVRDDDVSFADKREWGVHPRLFQQFGIDFSADDVRDFAEHYLLPDLDAISVQGQVVLNVRRGDYYSNVDFRAAYGMDIEGYVEEALKAVPAASEVLVVSDDQGWCEAHLGDALRSQFARVAFAAADPWGNLQAVASASCLVGTNSSFSYWGGYLSRVRDPAAVIIMPRFHKRTILGGRADQLDPTWSIVESIPGGWEEKVQ